MPNRLVGALRQIVVASAVRPTVFPRCVSGKKCVFESLTVFPLGLLFVPTSTMASTLTFTVTISMGCVLYVPLRVSQDAKNFKLHRILRDGVYRLVLWLR